MQLNLIYCTGRACASFHNETVVKKRADTGQANTAVGQRWHPSDLDSDQLIQTNSKQPLSRHTSLFSANILHSTWGLHIAGNVLWKCNFEHSQLYIH